MESHLACARLSPTLYRAYLAMSNTTAASRLELSLLGAGEKIGRSQINGCAFGFHARSTFGTRSS